MLFLFMQVIYNARLPFNYVFLGFSALMALMAMGSGGWKLNNLCAIFLGVALLSIMSNDIPAFFKPWQRFALFLTLMGGCSPLVNGPGVNKVRRQMFMGALWAMAVITMWSFIGRFTGQGQYLSGIVNGYMGVSAHPNFLGFYVMIVMVWMAALFFRCTEMKERALVGGFWTSALIVLLMTASRTSVACALLGTLVAVYLRLREKTGSMITVYVFLVGVVIFAWPIIAPYTEAMMKKNMDINDTDAMVAASRGAIWKLRYAEINESPWLGVGAYSCDINLPNAKVFYDSDKGTVELGSSYLGMLSQCGWLGFIAFITLLLQVAWKVWRYATDQRTPYAQLMFPLCIAIGVHMVFEGYAMTAGAVQCVILWMLIGAADQCDKVADYPVAWEKEDPITPEEYVQWRDANNK